MAWTTHDQPQEEIGEREQAREGDTPRRMWRRGAVLTTPLPLESRGVRRLSPVSPASSAPDDAIADLRGNRRRQRQEQVDARPEFHDAEALTETDGLSGCQSRHDPSRENADDLPADDDRAVLIEPHLGPLVELAGIHAVRRQEFPRMVLHPRHAPGNRRAVDVDIHRRQKDADLLPLPGRRAGAGRRANDHHAAVRRRHDEPRILGAAVRIAKEERKEAAEGPAGLPRRRRATAQRDGKRQRAEDEEPPRSIDHGDR
jgi:hypothetical protein